MRGAHIRYRASMLRLDARSKCRSGRIRRLAARSPPTCSARVRRSAAGGEIDVDRLSSRDLARRDRAARSPSCLSCRRFAPGRYAQRRRVDSEPLGWLRSDLDRLGCTIRARRWLRHRVAWRDVASTASVRPASRCAPSSSSGRASDDWDRLTTATHSQRRAARYFERDRLRPDSPTASPRRRAGEGPPIARCGRAATAPPRQHVGDVAAEARHSVMSCARQRRACSVMARAWAMSAARRSNSATCSSSTRCRSGAPSSSSTRIWSSESPAALFRKITAMHAVALDVAASARGIPSRIQESRVLQCRRTCVSSPNRAAASPIDSPSFTALDFMST